MNKVNEYLRQVEYRKKNKEKVRARASKWFQENKTSIISKRNSRIQSGFTEFLKDKLCKSKIRAIYKNRENDLDLEYLINMLHSQKFLCAATGLNLTFKFNDYTAVSIDRIDSRKGYVKGNIQLVCQFFNIGKNDQEDEEAKKHVKEFLCKIVKSFAQPSAN